MRIHSLAIFLASCAAPAPVQVDTAVMLPSRGYGGVAVVDLVPASRKQFSACVEASVCADVGTEPANPAIVSRDRAEQYCSWRGARLLTAEERTMAPVPLWGHLNGQSVHSVSEWTHKGCLDFRVENGHVTRLGDCEIGAWVRCIWSMPASILADGNSNIR